MPPSQKYSRSTRRSRRSRARRNRRGRPPRSGTYSSRSRRRRRKSHQSPRRRNRRPPPNTFRAPAGSHLNVTLIDIHCTEVGCLEVLSTQEAFKRHLQAHGLAPYPCLYPGCSETFQDSSLMGVHTRDKHPRHGWRCQHVVTLTNPRRPIRCKVVVNSQRALNEHIERTHQWRTWGCSLPDCVFQTANYRTAYSHVTRELTNHQLAAPQPASPPPPQPVPPPPPRVPPSPPQAPVSASLPSPSSSSLSRQAAEQSKEEEVNDADDDEALEIIGRGEVTLTITVRRESATEPESPTPQGASNPPGPPTDRQEDPAPSN